MRSACIEWKKSSTSWDYSSAQPLSSAILNEESKEFLVARENDSHSPQRFDLKYKP